MSDYSFSGLDEMQKSMMKVISTTAPERMYELLVQVGHETVGRTKELTPVVTSHLRDNWKVGAISKRGNDYVIEVNNNVEYCDAVEYGRRLKSGGLSKGARMLNRSCEEMSEALPDFMQTWIEDTFKEIK